MPPSPHKAVDTTLVAAHIVIALHSIVSRNVDDAAPRGADRGHVQDRSNASNIIPDCGPDGGHPCAPSTPNTARSWRPASARSPPTRRPSLWCGGGSDLAPGYPVTINDSEGAAHAVEAARAVANAVADDVDPIMPSEDFSYMPGGNAPAPISSSATGTAPCATTRNNVLRRRGDALRHELFAEIDRTPPEGGLTDKERDQCPCKNRFAELLPRDHRDGAATSTNTPRSCLTPTAPARSWPRSCANSAVTRSSTASGATGVVGYHQGGKVGHAVGPHHRPARRHGRAADPRGKRAHGVDYASQEAPGSDACLRP